MILLLALVYWPTLGFGPIAEDLQWAVKGATICEKGARLLTPFLQVLRPGPAAFFTAGVAIFGQHWLGYRALQAVLLVTLAALGWTVLRSVFGLSPPAAGLGAALWLASPLATEVFCVTCEVIQILLGIGVLAVLVLRRSGATRARRAAIALAGLVAISSKEEWVVLPLLVMFQDRLLFGLPARRCAARSLPWWGALAGYLVVHHLMLPTGLGWYYRPTLSGMMAKLVVTLGSFLHILQPAPWLFEAIVVEHPFRCGLVAGAVVALALAVVVTRSRASAYAFLASALMLLPTLAGGGQAPRYTLLPWLFFLAGCLRLATKLAERTELASLVRYCLAAGATLLLIGDSLRARADVVDWGRLAAVTARLDNEIPALRLAARDHDALVVLRGNDDTPLRALLADPRGQIKFYFPRPDDPYGVVALSALLTWHEYESGKAWERVATLPQTSNWAAFVHHGAGFQRGDTLPTRPVRFPGTQPTGIPGVILVARSWSSFAPPSFP